MKEKKEFTQRSQRWELRGHREKEERTRSLQMAQSVGNRASGCHVRGDLKVAATPDKGKKAA